MGGVRRGYGGKGKEGRLMILNHGMRLSETNEQQHLKTILKPVLFQSFEEQQKKIVKLI